MQDDPEDITGWQRLDARTTTSGRIEAGDVARLAALGVRRVINLALADSPGALPDEAALMAAAGIAYVHVPVPFDAPAEDHYRRFREAVEEAGDEPVHVHCVANWRVSAFFCRYNRDVRGMPEDEARALMERQWQPESHPHPAASAWAALISRRED